MIFEKSKNINGFLLKNKNNIEPLHLISDKVYNYFTPYTSLSISLTNLREDAIKVDVLSQEFISPNRTSVFMANAVSNLFNKSTILWNLKRFDVMKFRSYTNED